MMKKPKVLLALSILFLVAGIVIAAGVNTRTLPSLNVVFPLGAVLAGSFLVVLLFEKESEANVDNEQHALEDAGIKGQPKEMPAGKVSGSLK